MNSVLRRVVIAAACTLGAGAVYALAEGGGALVVFDWSGYEDPLLHPAYTAKYGAEPTFAFFGDEDEAFEKMRAGFKADIAHPCSQSVVKWREAGMLQPLDTSRIAGWKDLNSGIMAMKDLAVTADGKAWFMSFDWGNTSLLYRTDKVTADQAQSLKIFADPRFKGRVTIGENVDDAYALASLVIGLKDWTKMTDGQFKQASTFLRDVHKNIRFYWTDRQASSTRPMISSAPSMRPACPTIWSRPSAMATATTPEWLISTTRWWPTAASTISKNSSTRPCSSSLSRPS